MADLALIRAAKAVDGKHRVMAKDELMSGVAMFFQGSFQPLDLDVALSSEAAPERIDKHHQKVTAPHEVGETRLPGGSVIRKIENSAKHCLTHHVVGRVIAGCVPDGDSRTVEPCHFRVEPISPLCAKCVRVRC